LQYERVQAKMLSTTEKRVRGRAQRLIIADRANAPPISFAFDFLNLPIELVTDILVLATASSLHWGTYRSLVRVSRAFRTMVYQGCFPYLPIMLRTQRDFGSFASLLAVHPTVGPRVRFAWFFFPGAFGLSMSVLQKCPNITHLACTADLLRGFVFPGRPFIHNHLKDLTVTANSIPWDVLLRQPLGRQLFSQLTHFRAVLQRRFKSPDFCFASLTHISYNYDDVDFDEESDSTPYFDDLRFPILRQIVPTFRYKLCRGVDLKMLKANGIAVDGRFDALACPRGWVEADIWEKSRRGERDIWTRARAEE